MSVRTDRPKGRSRLSNIISVLVPSKAVHEVACRGNDDFLVDLEQTWG